MSRHYRVIEFTVRQYCADGMYSTALNSVNQAFSRSEITRAEYETLRQIINRARDAKK